MTIDHSVTNTEQLTTEPRHENEDQTEKTQGSGDRHNRRFKRNRTCHSTNGS